MAKAPKGRGADVGITMRRLSVNSMGCIAGGDRRRSVNELKSDALTVVVLETIRIVTPAIRVNRCAG